MSTPLPESMKDKITEILLTEPDPPVNQEDYLLSSEEERILRSTLLDSVQILGKIEKP